MSDITIKELQNYNDTQREIIERQQAEIERLRKELAEKDDYIRTVSRPISSHSYE